MKPTSRGKTRTLFILIVIIVVVAAVVSFLWDQSCRASERHDYSYEIEISYNTTLENVTLLVPVPELDGTPAFADILVNGTGYGVPEDWNLSIEDVNGTPMLAIQAARMVPVFHAYPVPVEPGASPLPATPQTATEYSAGTPVLMPIHLAVMIPANQTIDTRNPLGHEPVLDTNGQFIPADRTTAASRGDAFLHQVPVYIRYTSDRPADIWIRVSIEGVNSIWRGGWLSNVYTDRVFFKLNNGVQGWVAGEGTLTTGNGVYY
ncbi:MAG: hypothetical protein GKC06_07010 [Methanomicrobiales archaeon]|nr:hypothetical protein [Methanomicrobiales archaeon]